LAFSKILVRSTRFTLLRAAGKNVERFNMNEKMALKFDSSTGPLKEVLA